MSGLAGSRRILVSVPGSPPPAECAKEMALQVLKQLLSNTLKYSSDDSPLRVSAELTGVAVVIAIVDRGPGVNAEERDHIFEQHYRGRATRSSTKGTVLGLASTKSIVQAHGGKIWRTNPTAGGAVLHVSLPIVPAGNG